MTRHSEKDAIQPANGRLRELAQDVLVMAKESGATEADVVVADGENLSVQIRLGSVDRLSKARGERPGLRVVADGEKLSVQIRLGSVDRLSKAREKRLGLRIFVGKRSASSSTSDFSAQ